MVANGDSAKQIWLTEYGAATSGTGGTTVTEDFQAQNVTDAYSVARATPWIGPVFWFTFQDKAASTGYVGYMGLLRSDGSAKPSWTAYAAAAAAEAL